MPHGFMDELEGEIVGEGIGKVPQSPLQVLSECAAYASLRPDKSKIKAPSLISNRRMR